MQEKSFLAALEKVDTEVIWALVKWLNQHREGLVGGRIYHGGLRKLEPRELEGLLVPPSERLLIWEPSEA